MSILDSIKQEITSVEITIIHNVKHFFNFEHKTIHFGLNPFFFF